MVDLGIDRNDHNAPYRNQVWKCGLD